MPTYDGINYTAAGAYADLDFAALGGVYTTPAGLGPRLGRIGTRSVMVDPTGKAMLLRGLYRVGDDDQHQLGYMFINNVYTLVNPGQPSTGRTLRNTVLNKYGSDVAWRDATGARIRSFHFNWVGKDSTLFNQGGGMSLISQADVG